MELKNKKILLTGGHGFLGKYVIDKLHTLGIEDENIISPSFEELDLRQWENCRKIVEGIDVIIHLAANVGGIGYNREHPGELFYDNIIMGVQLIEAARLAQVEKFISLGTICAYPKITPVPFREEDIWNGYPEETNAPYGLAKKMLLVQAQAYRKQYDMNVIYLLPTNLYGPGDNFNPDSSHVIPALIKKVTDAKKNNQSYIEVWGTGNPTREFLYVEDAARAIILASQKYDKSNPINLGSGFEISIRDLVSLICQLMDYPGEIRWDSSRPDGQPRRSVDVSHAKQEFGFHSEVDFQDGLKKTIDWYLERS